MSASLAFFLGGLSCFVFVAVGVLFVFHTLSSTPKRALESLAVLLRAFSDKVPALYVVVKTEKKNHLVSFAQITRAIERAQCLRSSTAQRGPYAAKLPKGAAKLPTSSEER
jgi:hypothetical protein